MARSLPHETEVAPYLGLGPGVNHPSQTRELGDFLKRSDFDTLDRENPFVEGMASNPAKSEKQARFMRACAHGAKMHKKCPPKSVARKFMHTGKGH